MQILLSIKPKYVQSIFTGTKSFEFRKTLFKNRAVRKALIYSSAPQKKIVGSFEIGKIIKKNPIKLWKICKFKAGISKEEFFKYFKGKEKGYAIEILSVKKFIKKVDPYKEFPGFRPPQSFYYFDRPLHPQRKLDAFIKI